MCLERGDGPPISARHNGVARAFSQNEVVELETSAYREIELFAWGNTGRIKGNMSLEGSPNRCIVWPPSVWPG